MSDFLSVKNHLLSLADKKRAKNLARFFKTGPGEYGEGDMFLGITVPQQREVAKKFVALPLADVVKLLHSKEHECRLTALIILVGQYSRATTDAQKRKIFNLYLSNAKWINNWDLVDLSSYQIVGAYLADKNRSRLLKLAHSKNIWEKRIAIISTFAFIKNKEYKTSFEIAEMLLDDEHDLIHKAVGWMLREIGKKCGYDIEMKFLDRHHKIMPRTMLRYSLEHFSAAQRRTYMKK